MSKNKKVEQIKEIVISNGLCLDISRPIGEIPQNLSKIELREKYFRPEFFALDLRDKTIPELKTILANLKKLSNYEPVSRTEYDKLFTSSSFPVPYISDEILAKLEMRQLHGSDINERDLKEITNEIERLKKIEK
jgi:hypothetical protein